MIAMTQTATGPAFETVSRGVSYYLRTNGVGRLELSSKRLSMATFGSVRHFDTLAEVEASVKAFKGLGALVEAEAVAA
jgi:hypothetical protein